MVNMERSKTFTRCMQHLRANQRCLRTNTTTTTRGISYHTRPRTKQPRPSSQAFSTTTQAKQDAPSSSSQSATQNRPNQQRTPAQSSQDSNRIDLSRITTNPNYRAPIRSQQSPSSQSTRTSSALGASTLASIDALIAKNRARSAAANQQKSQSSSPSRPTYNDDLYGKGGSIFSRIDPSSTATSNNNTTTTAAGANTFDVRALLRNLDTPAPGLANAKPVDPILRLKPTLGKTVEIDEGRNFSLTRAFQVLETRINKNGNNVKYDEIKQKFHVRRGQLKKIDRRTRWRIMFKAGFLGECARVRRMIKQGW